MKLRFLVLWTVLLLVISATTWRIITPRETAQVQVLPAEVRAAPDFTLFDQHDRTTKLKAFLNRHQIIIRFFDAETGPEADPVIQKLVEFQPALKRAGVISLAVSSPLNPDRKKAAKAIPIPILRDTPSGQPGSCTQLWGRATATPGSNALAPVTPATFLIRADGLVEWHDDAPVPVNNPEALIRRLVSE